MSPSHQYVIIATLASEDAAEKFMNIMMRKGTSLCPLTNRDPIVAGSDSALVVTTLATATDDARVVNRFVKECIAKLPWYSVVVMPAETLGSLQWTCRGSSRHTTTSDAPPASNEESTFNEDEWFAQGENMTVDAEAS